MNAKDMKLTDNDATTPKSKEKDTMQTDRFYSDKEVSDCIQEY